MITKEKQKQIESIMSTQKLEEKRERIVHNILSEYAKDNGLVKYEYPDGFYCFGNPDSQEFADKKHEEWLMKKQEENKL
jgi:prophage tail gpP-like protein